MVMVWVFILIICGITFLAILSEGYRMEKLFCIIPVVIAWAILMWPMPIAIEEENEFNETATETTTIELISVGDNYGISGSVSGNTIYVYGSVSTEPIYSYYYIGEDGDIYTDYIPAKDTPIHYIKEGENQHPRIEITYDYYPNRKGQPEVSKTRHYKVCVPEGSVESSFKFDAE